MSPLAGESGPVLARSLQHRGIGSQSVLDAIATVPRDQFVPQELQSRAWDDTALPIGQGQTISQPFVVAWMSEALALSGRERVLEIGTGSGYQTAILARLADSIVTVERLLELSEQARGRLDSLGVDNVEYRVGDGTLGCPDRAPFDAIIVTAGAPDVPEPLYRQLSVGGRLVIPIGTRSLQEMEVVTKTPAGPVRKKLGGCRFVDLIGESGWPEGRD